MPSPASLPSLDAIVDAVLARLAPGRPVDPGGPIGPGGPGGPFGEPEPGVPSAWQPPTFVPGPRPTTRPSLRIAGVEYTQSTQHHSLVTPSYGGDNSVPLVAYKPMLVRVYPYVVPPMLGEDTLSGRRVTGDVTLMIGDRVLHQGGPTRAEGSRIGTVDDIDRTSWDREVTGAFGFGSSRLELLTVNCPLNFLVPAPRCRPGRVHVRIRVWPVEQGPLTTLSAVSTGYVTLLSVPVPKVCLVRVNWTAADGTRSVPSDAAMLQTLSLAERMLPFPYFEATILDAEIESTAAFAPAAMNGGCNAAWSSLVTELNVTRIFTALFQLGDIVYGMVPQAAIPAGSGDINAGCGRGAGGGFVGYDMTFAHEIGHLYGRPHVAVAGDPGNDTAYPNYGGSATSIGEVGVDVGTVPPTLHDPATSDDVMSYGDNQWISPYTYRKILEARHLHQSAAIRLSRWRELFVIDFRLYREGLTGSIQDSRVELRLAARFEAPGPLPPVEAGTRSPVSIDLLDAHRQVIATHHCTYGSPRGCGCGVHRSCGCDDEMLEREPWLDLTEVIEWPADVAAISFHRGGDPLHTIEVGERPTVAIEGPNRADDALTVTVRTEHSSGAVSVVVLFTNDGGATWRPVAVDPPDGTVTIREDRLAGGERCMFRALATAALQTATADTEPFELESAGRRLWLDLPPDGCPIAPGPVRIGALVDTRGLGAVAPQDVTWSSEVDGHLGEGYAIAPELTAGRHVVTATVPDGRDGSVSERGIIVVGG